jgi:hypothetical protein
LHCIEELITAHRRTPQRHTAIAASMRELAARRDSIQAELTGLDRNLLDEMFAVLIQDFSAYATELHGKATSTAEQAGWALAHVRRPVVALSGACEMHP